jgi:hypothetical protein
VAIKVKGLALDIRSISAEVMDLVYHTKDKDRQDSGRVCRMRVDVQVEGGGSLFFKQGSVDTVSMDADGKVHEVNC